MIPLAPVVFEHGPTVADQRSCTLITSELGFTGDAMVHEPQRDWSRRPDGTWAMPGLFDAITPWTATPDAMFANLETPIAGEDLGYTGYPAFNASPAIVDALKVAGVDVLQTANNHALDRGLLGLERTLEAVRSRGFLHSGTWTSVEERERPLVFQLPTGLRVGYIAYTYAAEVGIVPRKDWVHLGFIANDHFAHDVYQLRRAGADLVVVGVHWGWEYEPQPRIEEVTLARHLTEDLGVDVVYGTHPHVLQPAEVRVADASGRPRDALVMYSLANLVSFQRSPACDFGVVATVTVQQCLADRRTWITGFRVMPFWIDVNDDSGALAFRARPAPATPALCGPDGYHRGDCDDLMRARKRTERNFPGLVDDRVGKLPDGSVWRVSALPDPSDPRPRPYFTWYAPLQTSAALQ